MMIGFALVGLLAFPVGGWAGFAGGDMYGIDSLKQKLVITETSVSCPVRGCAVRVARQRGGFRRERKYLCPEHGIYVSPTTFEYANEARNLLWNKPADMSLLAKIGKVKHEGRFGRDNSEDALTWKERREQHETHASIARIRVRDCFRRFCDSSATHQNRLCSRTVRPARRIGPGYV